MTPEQTAQLAQIAIDEVYRPLMIIAAGALIMIGHKIVKRLEVRIEQGEQRAREQREKEEKAKSSNDTVKRAVESVPDLRM